MTPSFEQLRPEDKLTSDLSGKIQQVQNEIDQKLGALEDASDLSSTPKAPLESQKLALAAEWLKQQLPEAVREAILDDADVEKRMVTALAGYEGLTPQQAQDFVSALPDNDSMLG